jgi:AGCS family alanine or glycine:cation symporter
VIVYRIVYTLVIIIGAAVPLKLVWNIADISTILMALPNLLSLLLLAGLVKRMKTDYFSKL